MVSSRPPVTPNLDSFNSLLASLPSDALMEEVLDGEMKKIRKVNKELLLQSIPFKDRDISVRHACKLIAQDVKVDKAFPVVTLFSSMDEEERAPVLRQFLSQTYTPTQQSLDQDEDGTVWARLIRAIQSLPRDEKRSDFIKAVGLFALGQGTDLAVDWVLMTPKEERAMLVKRVTWVANCRREIKSVDWSFVLHLILSVPVQDRTAHVMRAVAYLSGTPGCNDLDLGCVLTALKILVPSDRATVLGELWDELGSWKKTLNPNLETPYTQLVRVLGKVSFEDAQWLSKRLQWLETSEVCRAWSLEERRRALLSLREIESDCLAEVLDWTRFVLRDVALELKLEGPLEVSLFIRLLGHVKEVLSKGSMQEEIDRIVEEGQEAVSLTQLIGCITTT